MRLQCVKSRHLVLCCPFSTASAAMRYEVTDRVLQLTLAVQGSRLGITLGDIEHDFEVRRRTAQRKRDAVLRNYPQSEQLLDDERRPRWRIPVSGAVTPGALSAQDVVDLEATAKLLRQCNLWARAASIAAIARKLRAALPVDTQRRLEPDIEALLEAEGLAMRPGPRPVIRSEVIETIRLAIKQARELYVPYRQSEQRPDVTAPAASLRASCSASSVTWSACRRNTTRARPACSRSARSSGPACSTARSCARPTSPCKSSPPGRSRSSKSRSTMSCGSSLCRWRVRSLNMSSIPASRSRSSATARSSFAFGLAA